MEQQKSEVLKLSEEISTQEKTVEVQEKHYKQALAAKERYRSKANYDVKKNQNQKLKLDHLSEEFDEMQRSLYRRIRDLERTVKDKENECDLLQLENEELMHAMPERSISTFHSGKFDDSVRQCCFRLLSLNVGARNVEPIIRCVLANFIGIDIDRLPKYSTIIGMLSEMKAIAYQQLSEELVGSEFTTLHSDGTTKFGQHYGSFQISTDKSAYTLGLMEMSCGSASSTLDRLKEILSDIDDASEECAGKKILVNIKNTMSDRHIVEKSFNNLLGSGRKD